MKDNQKCSYLMLWLIFTDDCEHERREDDLLHDERA
jgi:hypothetical protein